MLIPALAVLLLGSIDLTAEEVDALYHQNARQAATLRVEWRRSITMTESWRNHADRETAWIKERFEAGEIPAENREVVRKSIERRATPTVIPATRTLMQDYWSDHERFQWRVLLDDAKGFDIYGPRPQRVSHPDVESTPDELTTSLKEHLIVTGGGKGLPFRTWYGGKRSVERPIHLGAISFEAPVSKGTLEFFPPLALPEADWNGRKSWIDLFGRADPVRAELVGHYPIGSVSTSVVVKAWPTSIKNSHAEKLFDVVRAFVDINRAAIPLRLEVFVMTEEHLNALIKIGETPLSGKSPPFPNVIVRDVEIAEISPSFFYPIRGFEDGLGAIPDDVGRLPTSLAVHEIIEWEAYRVQPNRKMSAEMFDLNFPPNTLIRDERTNEGRLTGNIDGHSEVVVSRVFAKQSPTRFWNSSRFWGGLVVAVAAVLMLWRWRFQT